MRKWLVTSMVSVGFIGSMAVGISAEDTVTDERSSSLVASSDEMVTVEDVVSEDMRPIYAADLIPGTYEIDVLSSSSMFEIARCQLTVEENKMSALLTMGGSGNAYLKLFMGIGTEAVNAAEEEHITFELDEKGRQIYKVPVEALDMGIECAAWSKRREKWYDRTLVFCAASLPIDAYRSGMILTAADIGLEDGTYTVDVLLEGGSGKTTVGSPVTLKIEDGMATTVITINSPHYDYVIVDGEKLEQVNTEGNSTFEIPVLGFDWKMPIVANSTALGSSHEIDYTLFFDALSIQETEE